MSEPTIENRPYLSAIDRTNRGLGRYELTSFYASSGAIKSFSQDVINYFQIPSTSSTFSLPLVGESNSQHVAPLIPTPILTPSAAPPPHPNPDPDPDPAQNEEALEHHRIPTIDAIIGLDALGFPLAGALSMLTDKPVILARKGGKIPMNPEGVVRTDDFGDYAVARVGVKSLEIRRDLLKHGMGVLIVDEWIDTGAQMSNLCQLLESLDVVVVGIATLNLKHGKHPGADKLWENYEVFAASQSPLGAVAEWKGHRALRKGTTERASRSRVTLPISISN